jgi:hypothetical protein
LIQNDGEHYAEKKNSLVASWGDGVMAIMRKLIGFDKKRQMRGWFLEWEEVVLRIWNDVSWDLFNK